MSLYSDLHEVLTPYAQKIKDKADKSTTYTKTEVDNLISEVEVETDTTLDIPGAPADSAETGHQIGLLKADLDAQVADINEKLNSTASNILSPMPTATTVWMSGTISIKGAANSTDAKRIRNSGGSSMPRAAKGDVIFVAYPYQVRIIAYNGNQLSTTNFYEAIQSDFVSGVIPIPDKYIGKYLGIVIKDSTQEDADISAAISTINDYVKIYRPSQYFDSVNDSINNINVTLGKVDQWIMAVDTESENETGKTDMAPAIMAMLTETGYCHLGEGIFYVSGIDMPEGSTLCGCGYKTEIRLLSSVTSGYAIKMTAYNAVSDLRVTGSYATPTISIQGARSGIAFIANFDGNEGDTTYKTEHCMLCNVWISKFQNSGIYCHNTSQTYRQGLHASNVFVSLCWCGINIDYNSEFNKFVNVLTAMCIRGCMNNGGNNVFTSCTFYGTKIAFYVDGTQPNSAHGTINGCTFCHAGSSKGSAITMTDVTAGFVISDCQIHYNSIDLTDCYGISFVGCEFGKGINSGKGATINIDGGGLVLFNGCMFIGDDDYPPEIAITNNTKVRFNGCYGSETGNAITA